ncbi:hypothetical protein BLA29_008476 [Euroglyphus maynei]|uniref:Uncharacterized protein n=1 Tax=Euroglyphus maynei TaxID=6958 RepID=A0A1Y3AXF9_EURMA|nr:hypothetical protein BLA29_008476 [Euroglyphus maynei]
MSDFKSINESPSSASLSSQPSRQQDTPTTSTKTFDSSQKSAENPEFSLVDLDDDNDKLKPLQSSTASTMNQNDSNQIHDNETNSFFKTKFSNFVSNLSQNFSIPPSDSEYESESSTRNMDNISKEQLIDLCGRYKERSRKYRERWTEVVKAYRETVDEKDKLKTVLTETQDKAIRRMNELKEQCTLEQEAKRHLEENLRIY